MNKKDETAKMKIGRNQPCPCGSGRKYKQCCLNKTVFSPTLQHRALNELQSGFEHIQDTAKKISQIMKEYVAIDVCRAVFCINLWRRNRSALSQCLTLNQALLYTPSFGAKPIETYQDFSSFFLEFKDVLPVTRLEDNIIDDYGEVFINFSGKSYSIVTGTGHQQVYSALRYLQSLAIICGKEAELCALLDYTNYILDLTRESNLPSDGNILFEAPNEDFWESIKHLFGDSLFQEKMDNAFQVIGAKPAPIEMRHFFSIASSHYPLLNLSILVDYYKLLLSSCTPQQFRDHITLTIRTLIEHSYPFDPNINVHVIQSPRIFSSDKKPLVPDGVLFAGFAESKLLLALESSGDLTQIIRKIKHINQTIGLQLVQRSPNKGHGAWACTLPTGTDIEFLLVDFLTDISSPRRVGNYQEEYVRCTALDAFYFLGFSENPDEIIEFLRFLKAEQSSLMAFGGLNNFFFTWKENNHTFSTGAIEYDRIMFDYNETEDFVFHFFKDKLFAFPRNDDELFEEPLAWHIRNVTPEYISIAHKGYSFLGGVCKRLSPYTNLFLSHNAKQFNIDMLDHNALNIIHLVDEILQNKFKIYSDYFNQFACLKGKTLQTLMTPKLFRPSWEGTSSSQLIISKAEVTNLSLVIKYSLHPNNVANAILNSDDQSGENQIFKELLAPLNSFDPASYQMLVEQLNADSCKKKTSDVFEIARSYYYSDYSLDTTVSPSCYVAVRKIIAQTCLKAGLAPGDYKGKDATKTVRAMQLSLVKVFENKLSVYDSHELHIKALNYYAVQINGVVMNQERYHSFKNLDDSTLQKFESDTRRIREELKRNAETAEYLIESNLAIVHQDQTQPLSEKEFEFLLAFADWLVTLQEAADYCFHTDLGLSISVDSEYKVDVDNSEEMQAINLETIQRKYNAEEYIPQHDQSDIQYAEDASAAFQKDTGTNLPMLITLTDYMASDIAQDSICEEIYPNVFTVSKVSLANSFNETLESKEPDLSRIYHAIDFLTLDLGNLKTLDGKQNDILPVWDREKRCNRFNIRPLIQDGEDLIFSPVIMDRVKHHWRSGIIEWYPPYEIGLPNLLHVLDQWKKKYEDQMVVDIAQLFHDANFDYVLKEVDLYRRFPYDEYPPELGDFDVFAVNQKTKEMWLIESKVLKKVGSVYEDLSQQKSFFFQHKDDEKFQRRIDYVKSNLPKILSSLKLDQENYSIVPYMVTNKLFSSRYKKIQFPIITYGELKNILSNAVATICSN